MDTAWSAVAPLAHPVHPLGPWPPHHQTQPVPQPRLWPWPTLLEFTCPLLLRLVVWPHSSLFDPSPAKVGIRAGYDPELDLAADWSVQQVASGPGVPTGKGAEGVEPF